MKAMFAVSFNRTSLELKLAIQRDKNIVCYPFNRTSLELKHVAISEAETTAADLLIEPVWN